MLRLAAAPSHPDLLHSPSKTGVTALMARGKKESAAVFRARPGETFDLAMPHCVSAAFPGHSWVAKHDNNLI